MGVPFAYMARKQSEAIVALDEYKQDQRKLLILKRQKNALNVSEDKKKLIEGQIKQLEFDIKNNPVKELIDEGILNTIVEDINLDDDNYSIRNKVSDWVEKRTENVPEVFKKTYSWAWFSRDTGAYKFLEATTRYSDFVARYAMYKWLTEGQENPVTKDVALKDVLETFVQYDPPSSRELQYLNDIGLALFTKYALRIQKVIFRLFRDRTDSALGLMLLENYMGNVPDPTDSFIPGINTAFTGMDELFAPGANLVLDATDVLIPI
jgi:hypothetical protein